MESFINDTILQIFIIILLVYCKNMIMCLVNLVIHILLFFNKLIYENLCQITFI
jgi:hypothetical protein